MNKIIIRIAVLAAICSIAAAAPMVNKPFTFYQPDGTPLTLIMNGDEYYMSARTSDGFTVVRDKDSGWICYAELSADGSDLVSTGVAVDESITASSAGVDAITLYPGKVIEREIKLPLSSISEKSRANRDLLGVYQPSVAQEPAESEIGLMAATAMPGTKDVTRFADTIRGLVIVFDFSDAPAGYTLQQYTDKINRSDYHYANGNAASLRTFYEDVSRGVFVIDNYVYGVFRAPETFAYYDNLNYASGAQILLDYGLNKMDDEGFDFSRLSTFSNGEIRALSVMYTGNPAAWAEGMWFHSSSWGGFSADGVHSGRYCTDSANDLSPGTLIHEYGHMAGEWPDAYSYIGGEPGTWGVMGGGYCDLPNPYFLYENGWLDGVNLFGTPGTQAMSSTDAHFAYFYYNPAQASEFYIIRPYTRSLMYCPDLPDEGLTFWRVNTNGDNANYPDRDRHIELVHANNSDTNKTTNVCFDADSLLDEFTAYTTPSSNWKFGTMAMEPSGMDVTNISSPGAEMSFTLGVPPVPVPFYKLNGNTNDISGNGFDGICHNFTESEQWTYDVFSASSYGFSRALRFDGIDDYVSCPAASGASDDFTATFWVNADKLDNMVVLDKLPAGTGAAGWSIGLKADGAIKFTIGSYENNSKLITEPAVYEQGRWTNIACTFAGGTAKIFVNGAPRAIMHGITQSVNTTAAEMRMGIASHAQTDLIYQGLLDSVRIYAEALDEGPLNAIDELDFDPDNGTTAEYLFEETSGTVAVDTSGHSAYGNLGGGMSFDSDAVSRNGNGALMFDGVDDYVSLAPQDKKNNGLTIALWAYPTAIQNWARFVDFGNGPYSDNIILSRFQTSNNLVLEIYNGDTSGGTVHAQGAIELNKWQYFTATVTDTGAVSLYKDGQLVSEGSTSVPAQVFRKNLYLGRSNWSADSFYKGAMDDVRVFNYPLTGDEINRLYRGYMACSPAPYSGRKDVAPVETLRFTPAADAMRHHIYFGTDYASVEAADTASAQYKGATRFAEYNPVGLQPWNEYFWRVDEVMSDGSLIKGDVWRFSTVGGLLRQVWTGLSSSNYISALRAAADYPLHPTFEEIISTFETPSGFADNYGTRILGYVCPRTSGIYRFWIAGDDEVELYLSSDDTTVNFSMIAYVHNASTSERDFDRYSTQRSAPVSLVAGERYMVKVLHKEGVGGDHISVAWQGPDSPERSVIDGFYISPRVDNENPFFAAEFTGPLAAAENRPFTGALTPATDYDSTNITYSKIAGPRWLTLAADGSLEGLPSAADTGANYFTVRATDPDGAFGETTLVMDVEDIFDGSMGLSDLIGLAENWLSDELESPGNIDGSGNVDNKDFAAFAANLGSGLINGLVGAWSMADVYGDAVRANYGPYNGTMVNMGPYRGEGALSFNGVEQYVNFAGFKGITGTSARSCCAWIKTNAAGLEIMSWGGDGNGEKWLILTNGDGTLRVGVNGGNINGTVNIADGQWHHIAVVLADDGSPNANEIKLYVDGADDTGSSLSEPINTAAGQDFQLGRTEIRGTLRYFDGLMKEVLLYDKALAPQDISQIYNAGGF
jgi:M6 family metalloprotease-like protein